MINYCILTNKGKRYPHNEDALFFAGKVIQNDDYIDYGSIDGQFVFAAIFDGVGGGEFGEVASSTCVNKLKETIEEKTYLKTDYIELIEKMNHSLVEKQIDLNAYSMMSTFVGVSYQDGFATISNVGDSKVYYYDQKSLFKKSVDDTLIEKLKKERVTDEVTLLNAKHVITNALGINNFEKYKSHYFEQKINKGDVIILMSDGISDHILEGELLEIIRDNNLVDASKLIEEKVVNKNAPDNYSLIMMRF